MPDSEVRSSKKTDSSISSRVNTQKFRKLTIRIPEEQFPDKLTFVFKGFSFTHEDIQVQNETDPRIQQLANNVANNPQEKLYELKFLYEDEFIYNETINGIKYKVYRKTFPMTIINQVHAWADREDSKDETQIDVQMQAVTESGSASSPSSTSTINMNDVWAYNFSITRQTMTPDSIFSFMFNGNPIGAYTTMILDTISYMIETMAKLPASIAATPKAILTKFLGPDSPAVQKAMAELATFYAKIQPTVDTITLFSAILQEFINDPQTAVVKYGMIVLSFIIAEYGPGSPILGWVYDFFGGYPVTSNPLDSMQIALQAANQIQI